MKKIVLALVAAAAVAAPLALSAGSANAAPAVGDTTDGVIDTTTHNREGDSHHLFNVVYKCTSVDGHGSIDFTATADGQNGSTNSGSATGVITPDASGGGTFTLSGTNGSYWYNYGGSYNASGVWTAAKANDLYGYTYGFGTVAPTSGPDYGNVSGSFTGIPDCSTPTVPVIDVPKNHGEYVSGAAHAGVKGKDLAAIAKDVTLVGPYKG